MERLFQLSDMADEIKTCAKDHQQEDKYAFVESIQNDLNDEYKRCKQIKGKGTKKKIKNCMESGISDKKNILFKNASGEVKKRLDTLQEELAAEAKSSLGSLVNEDMSNAILTIVRATPSKELSSLRSDFRKQLEHAMEIDKDVKEFSKTDSRSNTYKTVPSKNPRPRTSYQQFSDEEDSHSPAKKAKQALKPKTGAKKTSSKDKGKTIKQKFRTK